jgi:putative phosphoribosyl transferase
MERYADRRAAGRELAPPVARALGTATAPLILALPRGGVPVAAEVAAALGADLDVLVVRKLGVPDQEELAFGAIASSSSDGAAVINADVVATAAVTDDEIAAVTARERAELERRARCYRGDRAPPQVRGRAVVLVDDGLATGATMRAAIAALRQDRPAHVIAAAPIGSAEAKALVALDADDVVCPRVPHVFRAVGAWYDDFAAVGDDAVAALLDGHASTIRRA